MAEDLLVYPTNKVVGIAEDADVLGEALASVRDTGIAEESIEVLRGTAAAEAADIDPTEQGPVGGAVRVVQHVLGEETPRLANLQKALEDGAFVVQVELPGDDDARGAAKHRTGRALLDAGATEVAYYGPMAIEELDVEA